MTGITGVVFLRHTDSLNWADFEKIFFKRFLNGKGVVQYYSLKTARYKNIVSVWYIVVY